MFFTLTPSNKIQQEKELLWFSLLSILSSGNDSELFFWNVELLGWPLTPLPESVH